MQCLNPVLLTTKNAGIYTQRSVPCGKCMACLSNRKNDWVVRLKEEYNKSMYSSFITLTYSDDNIPYDGVSKSDCQLFMKRFRKSIEPIKCRFFLVSEYGTHTFRPHYHAILFFQVYVDVALHLTSTWTSGFFTLSEVNNSRLAYCAKYCLGVGAQPDGQNKVFMLCSRRPAIGSEYLTSAKLDYHRISLSDFYVDKGVKRRLPRYYRDKIFDDDMKSVLKDSNVQRSKDMIDDYLKKHGKYDIENLFTAPSANQQSKELFKQTVKKQLDKSSKL